MFSKPAVPDTFDNGVTDTLERLFDGETDAPDREPAKSNMIGDARDTGVVCVVVVASISAAQSNKLNQI